MIPSISHQAWHRENTHSLLIVKKIIQNPAAMVHHYLLFNTFLAGGLTFFDVTSLRRMILDSFTVAFMPAGPWLWSCSLRWEDGKSLEIPSRWLLFTGELEE